MSVFVTYPCPGNRAVSADRSAQRTSSRPKPGAVCARAGSGTSQARGSSPSASLIALFAILSWSSRRRYRAAASRACGLAGRTRARRPAQRSRTNLLPLGLPGRRRTCWRAPLVRHPCPPYRTSNVVALVIGQRAVPGPGDHARSGYASLVCGRPGIRLDGPA